MSNQPEKLKSKPVVAGIADEQELGEASSMEENQMEKNEDVKAKMLLAKLNRMEKKLTAIEIELQRQNELISLIDGNVEDAGSRIEDIAGSVEDIGERLP
jgi:predicted nuclease with TOPRIM domain